jgi:hypothetical protein
MTICSSMIRESLDGERSEYKRGTQTVCGTVIGNDKQISARPPGRLPIVTAPPCA